MRVSKMGERMETSRSEVFMELCVTAGGWGPRAASMDGRMVLPHGSEFLITRVNTATGTHHWGWEKGIKKKYTFGVFSFFASLHCVTKYISALSHILVQ